MNILHIVRIQRKRREHQECRKVGEHFPSMFSVPDVLLSKWTETKSSILGFLGHLSQPDSTSAQSPCPRVLHHSLVSSLSLSCSPSVTTHLHLPLPSPHLTPGRQQLPYSSQVFPPSALKVSGSLKQGSKDSKYPIGGIPTLLPPTAPSQMLPKESKISR